MKRNKLFWSFTAFLTLLLFNPISGQAVQGKTSNDTQNSSKSSQDLPVDYQIPVISGQKNTKSAEIKTKVKVYLPRQSSNEFYEDMSFQVNLGEYSENLTTKNTKIKMTDEANGEDISSFFPDPKFPTSTEGENVLKFSLPKSKLKELAKKVTDHDITMSVEITVPIASNESIKDTYNDGSKGFEVPIPVEHDTLGRNTGKSFVGMQVSADPVKNKEVKKGTSTDDLTAKDYVKNVESLYPEDEFTYSFKEKVDFTEIGTETVNIVVKSNNTDVEKVVPVDIEVVDPAKQTYFNLHPYSTFLNDIGEMYKGKALPDNFKGIIPLKFLGDKISDELLIKAAGETEYVKWDGQRATLTRGTELILNKVGNYKGEYIKAKVTVKYNDNRDNIVYLEAEQETLGKPPRSSLSFRTKVSSTSISLVDISLLDKDNNPLSLEKVIFPITKDGPANGSHLNVSSENINNVIVKGSGDESIESIFDNTNLLSSIINTQTGPFVENTFADVYDLYWKKGDLLYYTFNILYSGFSEIIAGVAINTDYNTSRVYGLFDKNAEIYLPVAYSSPSIVGKKNTETTEIESKVKLYLPRQSATRFYEDMSFQVNLSKYSEELTAQNTKITIKDEAKGQDLSSYFSAPTFSTSATGEKLLNFSLTKDILKNLADNVTDRDIVLDINITAPMELTESIKNIYDSTEQGFKVPVSVIHKPVVVDENTELLGGNTSTAIVGMHLSADAVKGKLVQRELSTDDLNAKEYVENVTSLFPNDEFTYSFKEKVEFKKTGPQVVNVVVKSNNTGAETVVPVEVTVIDNPLVFVTVTESIDLKQIKKTVVGEGQVGYSGPTDVNIEVNFSDPVKLNNSENDTVDLFVFNEGKTLVHPGEQLAMLNKTKKTATFSMNAPKEKFKKVDIYEGSMLVNFTIK